MTELSIHKDLRQRRYPPEKQKEIVERWKISGMAKAKFCKEQGIAPSTLYQWLHQSADSVQSSPVHLSAVHISDKKEMPTEEDIEQTLIEISLSAQTVMRFKLPIKNLLVFVTELCHAAATLRS